MKSLYNMGKSKLVVLILLFFVWEVANSQTQTLKFENTSTYIKKGTYNWTIYIKEPESVLNNIQEVQYTLHPTFPNPIRTVKIFKGGFPLSGTGWGEFEIKIKVTFRNGSEGNYSHYLKL